MEKSFKVAKEELYGILREHGKVSKFLGYFFPLRMFCLELLKQYPAKAQDDRLELKFLSLDPALYPLRETNKRLLAELYQQVTKDHEKIIPTCQRFVRAKKLEKELCQLPLNIRPLPPKKETGWVNWATSLITGGKSKKNKNQREPTVVEKKTDDPSVPLLREFVDKWEKVLATFKNKRLGQKKTRVRLFGLLQLARDYVDSNGLDLVRLCAVKNNIGFEQNGTAVSDFSLSFSSNGAKQKLSKEETGGIMGLVCPSYWRALLKPHYDFMTKYTLKNNGYDYMTKKQFNGGKSRKKRRGPTSSKKKVSQKQNATQNF